MSAQLLPTEMPELNNRRLSHSQPLEAPERVRSFPSSLFILMLVGGCLFAGLKLLDPTTLPIRHVRVEGNFQYLSETNMRNLVSDVIRGGFFNLNVKTIQKALLTDPWVDWVVVQRVWPDGIRVHVKEQIATSHWNDDALLNGVFEAFSPENAGQLAGIPYLSGPHGSEKQVAERFNSMQTALQPYSLQVLKINLSARRAWKVQIGNGPLVLLGRNDIDERFERFLDSALRSLGEEIEKVEQIDLRYTNGFAVQWKNSFSNSNESGLNNNG